MIPVNQVILGGGDPLLGTSIVGNNIDEQLQLLEKYKQNLEAARQAKQQIQNNTQQNTMKLIWDDIDVELASMSEDQKKMLFQDDEYADIYTKINELVNSEILNLVKVKIESSSEGKELLSKQLKVVKKLKEKIMEETNKEMELFRKFKEFSKQHPEVTYEEFIKNSIL